MVVMNFKNLSRAHWQSCQRVILNDANEVLHLFLLASLGQKHKLISCDPHLDVEEGNQFT